MNNKNKHFNYNKQIKTKENQYQIFKINSTKTKISFIFKMKNIHKKNQKELKENQKVIMKKN